MDLSWRFIVQRYGESVISRSSGFFGYLFFIPLSFLGLLLGFSLHASEIWVAPGTAGSLLMHDQESAYVRIGSLPDWESGGLIEPGMIVEVPLGSVETVGMGSSGVHVVHFSDYARVKAVQVEPGDSLIEKEMQTVRDVYDVWIRGVVDGESLICGDWSHIPTYRFPSCTQSNDYGEEHLEGFFEKHSGIIPNGIPLEDGTKFPMECVYASMKRGLSAYQSASCASQSSAPDRSSARTRACLSRQAFYAAYNSFIHVSSCFDIDPKEIFPIINKESRFQQSALSHTGAAGPGQLTEIAIQDVNRRISRFQRHLEKKGEECGGLRKMIDESNLPSSSFEHRCGLMYGEDNPLLAMMYGAMYWALLKDHYLLSGIPQLKKPEDHPKLKKLSSNALQKLKMVLTQYSYNMGYGALSGLFKAFLSCGHPSCSWSTVDELLKAFSAYVRNHHRSKKRRDEFSAYATSVAKEASEIQRMAKQSENSCSI